MAFNFAPLLTSIKVFGAANALGWSISMATGSHLHLDLIGTGAFCLAAGTGLPSRPMAAFGLSQTVSAGIIGAWGARLAGFLFYRALQTGHDGRLDATLSTTSGTTGFWTMSVLWGVMCCLPHTIAAGLPPRAFGAWGHLGAALAVLGVCIEATADYQKWRFKKENPGKFCDAGIWAVSQHPNYLGNICLWSGILLLNGSRLAQRPWAVAIGFLSPLFMYFLFNSQATGQLVSPSSVDLAYEKYGDDPRFVQYASTVPLIFPWGSAPGPREL